MRIYCFWLVISLSGSILSCNNTEFRKTPCKSFSTEILVYAKDSTGIFTYNPRNGENKRILSIQKKIVPETFSLINDSLLTFTTLESMKIDSILSERIYTDTNKVKHSYLSATYYWVVTEKVHLISLCDGRHYVPQVNEYYVHGFQSQKFSTFGFPGNITFCIPDTVKEFSGYYSDESFNERTCLNSIEYLGSSFLEEYRFGFSESKTINGVKLVTFQGNLILINNGHVSGILEYNGPFSWKMETIGYYAPDISGNGKYFTSLYEPYRNFTSGGIYVSDIHHQKKRRIADRKGMFPKISYSGDFVAYMNQLRLITIVSLKENTHTCIGEGNYYEWTQK